MNLSSRAKKRTLLVSVVILVILGGAGVAYMINESKQDDAALRSREEGLAAVEAERYPEALDRLGRYLQRFGTNNDPDAIHGYATARLNVELPNNKHIFDAAGLFQRAVDADITHVPARERLFELFTLMGRNTEMVNLADAVLAVDPGDATAMLSKAVALQRLRKFDEALEAAQQLTEAHPNNPRGHSMVMSLMRDLDEPNDNLVDYAQRLVDENPDEPRLALLLAQAMLVNRRIDEGVGVLQSLAEAPIEDPKMALALAERLDQVSLALGRADLSDLAVQVAESKLESADDPALRRWLIQNAWELLQHNRVIELAADAQTDRRDALTPALVVMSLYATGQADRAEQALAALEDQSASQRSQQWAQLIRMMNAGDSGDSAQRLSTIREAVRLDPANPYFRFWLGEQLQRMGETEEAVEAWTEVLRLRPGWWLPQTTLARQLRELGRHEDALKVATQGRMANPKNRETFVIWAQIVADALAEAGPAENQRLLDDVVKYRRQAPGDARMRLLEFELLLRLGQTDRAKTLADRIIASGNASETEMLRLAQISREHNFGLESQIMSEVETQHGQTPAVVFVQAMTALQQGEVDAGLAIIDEAMRQIDDADRWRLELARVRYLEAARDPQAIDAWRRLTASWPNSIPVQNALLESQAAWSDLDLINQSIERLKALTGEGGISWRLARARWLIEKDRGQRDDAIAADMLSKIVRENPDSVEARLLLARAMEKLGNLSATRSQLAQVAELKPDNVRLLLNLAAMALSVGDTEDAMNYLDSALARPLGPAESLRAASLAATLGRQAEAVQVLERLTEDDQLTPAAQLLLAKLYIQTQRLREADALLDGLYASADAAMFADIVRLLATRGQLDTLKRLGPTIEAAPGSQSQRALAMSLYEQAMGDLAAAADRLTAAQAADPADTAVTQSLINLLIQQGDLAAALAAAQRHQSASDQDPHAIAIRDALGLVNAAADEPTRAKQMRLAQQVVQNPAQSETLLELMKIYNEAGWDPQAPGVSLISQLRQLAGQHPHHATPQLQLAQAVGAAGNKEEMLDLALQTMRLHPANQEAAHIAMEALVSLQRWSEVVPAADEYASRGGNRQIADLRKAEGLVNSGEPVEAAAILKPYVASARQQADLTGLTALRLYVAAEVAAGEIDVVRQLLEPDLASSERARDLWRSAAAMLARRSPSDAMAWLAELEPLVAEDALAERIRLAAAYKILRDEAAFSRGLAILDALSQQSGLNAQQWMIIGVLAEQMGNARQAESSYRAALADEDLHQAANNLAMVLARENRQMEEALDWALKANAWLADNPNYLDTLAFVYAAMGRPLEATTPLEQAVAIEPNNPMWRIHLAATQLKAGQHAKARETIRQVDRDFPGLTTQFPTLAPERQRILDELAQSEASARSTAP